VVVTSRRFLGDVEQITLIVLTAGVGALTILPGRATLQEGAIHLVIFGAFLVFAVNP
jgi:Ca2+:H+ antiporter